MCFGSKYVELLKTVPSLFLFSESTQQKQYVVAKARVEIVTLNAIFRSAQWDPRDAADKRMCR